jgi:hypothetical protein
MAVMKNHASSWSPHAGKRDSGEPGLDSNSVRPYGRYGVGTFTAHPAGLLVVIAVIAIAVMKLPPARLFFLCVAPVGGIIGFILWLRNRNRGF